MSVMLRLTTFINLFVLACHAVLCAQEARSGSAHVLDPGVVVEALVKSQEGDKAGIRPGDILTRWSRGNATGTIDSPFDLRYLWWEQSPRGVVRLSGVRDKQPHVWFLGPELWGIWSYPNMQGELLTTYIEGRELSHAGKREGAIERWQSAAVLARNSGAAWLSAWFLSHAAQIYGEQWEGYNRSYEIALQQSVGGSPVVRADLFRQWGSGSLGRNDLGKMQWCLEQQLAELERLGNQTMAVSTTFLDLGWVAKRRGDLDKAAEYYRKGSEIAERLAPESLPAITGLQSVAGVLLDQGDLLGAERYFQQALTRIQRDFPSSRLLAMQFEDLGVIAHRRGELAKARAYYQRALKVAERTDPGSVPLAEILSYLAESILDEGDPRMAEYYQLRALGISQSLQGNGSVLATSLRNLGKIARTRGDLAKASDYYQQALTITQKLAPRSLEMQRILIGLAYVARHQGDASKAEQYLRNALALMEESIPASLQHSETVADLASILVQEKKFDEAAATYERSLAELENKANRLGSAEEDEARYRANNILSYKEYADLLIQLNKPALGFQTIERAHARTLFEVLSRSHVDIHQGVGPQLLTRERGLRQSITAKYQARIRLLNETHAEESTRRLDQEIAGLRESYNQLEAEIRASSPAYSALTQPASPMLKDVQGLLDQDTVLLEYLLGEDRSYVWVVGENSLEVRELPKRTVIERLAHDLYRNLTTRTHRTNTDPQIEVTHWARADAQSEQLAVSLGGMILAPITHLIAGKRLLIVSDGALQYIPFAALPIPGKSKTPLIVEHEIVNLPSASVLAEIRRARVNRPRPPQEVAVLADPVFDPKDERLVGTINGSLRQPTLTQSSLSARRSAGDVGLGRKRGFSLNRLIYSRDEAEAIVSLSPRDRTLLALDFQASRKTAISPKLANYRIIHFATHGFLDSKHPELSGLVLSLVDHSGKAQDGFLGLEDVYNLNLPVDLVVLSGCRTALGEEISGEGLMGLTRGFMYAGASRVVASLWNVDDYTTAELMADFYRAMERDRMAPAAALRKAQIQIWKHRGWQPPYYWAAFQIQGEWK